MVAFLTINVTYCSPMGKTTVNSILVPLSGSGHGHEVKEQSPHCVLSLAGAYPFALSYMVFFNLHHGV